MALYENFDNADTKSVNTLDIAFEYDHEIFLKEEKLEFKKLSKNLSNLHTKLLYYRNSETNLSGICENAYNKIIKCISSPDCWQDLASRFGISKIDVEYIMNSKLEPGDIVLKMFMVDENAYLDKVVNTLVKMERYDIVQEIKGPLTEMYEWFKRPDKKSDTGYCSYELNKENLITIDIPIDLPLVLKSLKRPDQSPENNNEYEDNYSKKKVKAKLMLTYAEDGIQAAKNIINKVNNWPDEYNTQVVSLNDRKEEVLQNPEVFIRKCFKEAIYIIPIITPKYMKKINSHVPYVPSTTDNLDCKYANFVYNLIINHYMHISGCLNKKVRSVLPENSNLRILSSISMYPVLMPWTYETSFDEQFQEFLKDHI